VCDAEPRRRIEPPKIEGLFAPPVGSARRGTKVVVCVWHWQNEGGRHDNNGDTDCSHGAIELAAPAAPHLVRSTDEDTLLSGWWWI